MEPLSILAAVFVLGVLVFVHELGHFVAAKRLGIRVFEFAIGFGPILFTKMIGDTAYRLRAIPFGGFVHMAGEDFEDDPAAAEQALAADEAPTEPKIAPHLDPENLMSKTVFQRFQVFFAGPFMNWLTALVIVTFLSLVGMPQPRYLREAAKLGAVDTESPARQSGLLPGDVVLSINDQATATWEEYEQAMSTFSSAEELRLRILRDGQEQTLTLPVPADKRGAELLRGAWPFIPLAVDKLVPGHPAEQAGLKQGDRILAIDGEPVDNWFRLIEIVTASPGKPLQFTVQRAGRGLELTITPQDDGTGVDGKEGKGKIGLFQPRYTEVIATGPVEAVKRGFLYTGGTAVLMLDMVRQLVSFKANAKDLGGPIMIMQQAGEVAKERDFRELLMFMAFLSMNLCILNLLPIPVLDGGHIMFLIPELFTGRIVSQRIRLISLQIGFFCLMGLMLFATYNDLSRLSLFRWIFKLLR